MDVVTGVDSAKLGDGASWQWAANDNGLQRARLDHSSCTFQSTGVTGKVIYLASVVAVCL